ncbi:hypothetical protein NSA19_01115 [Actinomyces bowdenii]|uniref:hypothetical protein n=1 Tax=Actinomyces bowdenii TaxID=131109 RepID=UPI00214ABA16|nr:hypothetical protein [Actinomyces bowdenii]MCR2051477.1 hypothetical protein [Actinomyces bowdenii]
MSRRSLNIISGIAAAACITEIILAEVYGHHTGMVLVAMAAVVYAIAATIIYEKEG